MIELDMSYQTHEPFSKTNTQWTNDKEVDLKKVKMPKVPNWQIIVELVAVKEKTKGGIILTNNSKEMLTDFTNIGKVLVVGDSAYKDARFEGKPWCKVGDYVVFDRHVAKKFKWKGYRLARLPDDKIDLVIEDPKDFDPSEDMLEL